MNAINKIDDLFLAAECQQIPAVYAGIGARKTPRDVLALMTCIARRLDLAGWTLRSGGADGADQAFVWGSEHHEIFTPWPRFNGARVATRLMNPTVKAMAIAAEVHPNWSLLTEPVKKLHARNVHQVLGADCTSPCSMVICWTPDGSTGVTSQRTGGTGQAIRIAAAHKIPIFNLQRHDHLAAWRAICAL